MGDTAEKKDAPRKEGVALATIGALQDKKVSKAIAVHFNPVSLQLTINNQLKKNSTGTQYIGTTTMKLTLDLIFDSTDTGQDVTDGTRQIQALLGPEKPPAANATNGPPPPEVRFEWGTIKFDGIIEGYKETIDFFSIDGVPLRSSVNLTISRADRVFEKASGATGTEAGNSSLRDLPAQSAAEASKNANAPGAAREIAGMNNQSSLRFGNGGPLTVGAGVQLKPAVAFSSGSAGAALSLGGGAGAGVSLGGSAGISLGGSADLSLGGSGGAGLSLGAGAGLSLGQSAGLSASGSAGISASAGISGLARLSASEGAFSGLRISTSARSAASFDPSKLAPNITSATAALDAGATFQVGGKATMQGNSGLRADVGASGKLSFDAG